MGVLVVGSVALDSVETPFGEARDALGGSATFFSIAASYFTEVSIVAVVGTYFPPEHIEFLQSKGVDTSGLVVEDGETFRWAGVYGYDLNERQTIDTRLNVFETFRPEVPESLASSEFLFLANIDPELQLTVLDQVSSPKLVACDTMNFWIEGKREALLEVMGRVDAIVLNDGECRELAIESNLIKAARAVLGMGPRIVIVKKGEHGATMFTGDEYFSAPAYPCESVFDPTGAGDSFAGGFIGYLANAPEALETIKNADLVLVRGNLSARWLEEIGLKDFQSLSFIDDSNYEETLTQIEEAFRLNQLIVYVSPLTPVATDSVVQKITQKFADLQIRWVSGEDLTLNSLLTKNMQDSAGLVVLDGQSLNGKFHLPFSAAQTAVIYYPGEGTGLAHLYPLFNAVYPAGHKVYVLFEKASGKIEWNELEIEQIEQITTPVAAMILPPRASD